MILLLRISKDANYSLGLICQLKRFYFSHGLVGHRKSDNKQDFQNPLVVAYYSVDYVKNTKGTNYWRNRVLKV